MNILPVRLVKAIGQEHFDRLIHHLGCGDTEHLFCSSVEKNDLTLLVCTDDTIANQRKEIHRRRLDRMRQHARLVMIVRLAL